MKAVSRHADEDTIKASLIAEIAALNEQVRRLAQALSEEIENRWRYQKLAERYMVALEYIGSPKFQERISRESYARRTLAGQEHLPVQNCDVCDCDNKLQPCTLHLSCPACGGDREVPRSRVR